MENLKTEERKDRKVEEDCGKNKEEKTAENEKSVTKKVRTHSREGLVLELETLTNSKYFKFKMLID